MVLQARHGFASSVRVTGQLLYGARVNFWTIVLLGWIAAPVAAGAAWLSKKLDVGWTPRQRVFNSAAIGPSIIAAGAVCFVSVVLALGGSQRLKASEFFIIQFIVATLSACISGMIAAYLVEKWMSR
jgi:hypothetical protein